MFQHSDISIRDRNIPEIGLFSNGKESHNTYLRYKKYLVIFVEKIRIMFESNSFGEVEK